MPATKIQLAIQGGGAKLPHLMAAAQPFQEFATTDPPRIEITRVAGTSSGSLVAAFIAAGIPLPRVWEYVNSQGGAHLAEVLGPFKGGFDGYVNKSRALLRVLRGRDILNTKGLQRLIEGIFLATIDRIPQLINDVEEIKGTKLFIIASDVSLGRSHTFTASDNLISSLINSCAYPFAFRNFNAMASTPYVDGGLCENLPADHLDKRNLYGHVFAISPKERPQLSSLSFNIISYTNSLFGTSINNGVIKTTKSVGESSVIQFDSDLDTFSFKESLSIDYDSKKIDSIRNISKGKINDYLHVVSLSPDGSRIYGGSFNSEDVLKSVYLLHKKLNKGEVVRTIETSMIAMANSLDTVDKGSPRKCDIITSRRVFTAATAPIRALSAQVQSDGEILAMKPLVWSLKHLRTNKRFKAELVPAIPDDMPNFLPQLSFILFLDEPIRSEDENDHYSLQYQYASRDGFIGILEDRRSDFMAMSNGTSETVPIADLIMMVPISYTRKLVVSLSDERARQKFESLTSEAIKSEHDICNNPNYNCYGARIRDLTPNERVQVDFASGGAL